MTQIQGAKAFMSVIAERTADVNPLQDFVTSIFALCSELQVHCEGGATVRRIASMRFGTHASPVILSIDTTACEMTVHAEGNLVATQNLEGKHGRDFAQLLGLYITEHTECRDIQEAQAKRRGETLTPRRFTKLPPRQGMRAGQEAHCYTLT